ncbi:cupin domain-containing protein [Pseudocolwellia sp. HL-MZ7]|uniref:cupin domain-containing protein n=1 Tax=Pseudocolwellia sp. HL-MZ7 TaxID=3400627 RepID=UPI003CFB5D9D
MPNIKIVKLSQTSTAIDDMTDELKVAKSNVSKAHKNTHCYYEDDSIGLYVGVSGANSLIECDTTHTFNEFISIIEGVAEIKNNKTGLVETVTAGESFVIPKGYDYQWHQSDNLRKFHLIYKPQNEPENSNYTSLVYFNEHNINENSSVPWQATSDGHNKKVLYQNPSQTFTSGIWQSKGFDTGFITFPYNEFMTIKQGNLTCTDTSGIEHKVSSGEALFIPKGTRCSWLATEDITIYFAQIK